MNCTAIENGQACGRPHLAHGLCRLHYEREYKHRDHSNRIECYSQGTVTLYLGDAISLLRFLNPRDYVLVADPPRTIRTAEHVDEFLATLPDNGGAHDSIVLTNPNSGYIRNRVCHSMPALTVEPGTRIQRPLAPMIELLKDTRGLIVDPFAGTGTTLLAAYTLKRKAIGIERDRKHYSLAINRLQMAGDRGVRIP
jgi:hypothetical protein